MLDSLPEPDFNHCTTINNLLYEVIKQMRETNYLENYLDRTERIGKIIELWGERSNQIFEEEMEQWNS